MQCNTAGLFVTKTILLWLLRKKNVCSHYKTGSKMYHANLAKLAVEKENSCALITFKKGDCDLRSIPKQFFFVDDTKSQFSIFKKTSAAFFLCYEEKRLVEPAFPGILISFESG